MPPGPLDTINVIVVELLTVEALLPLFMAVSAMIDGRASLKTQNTAKNRLAKYDEEKLINTVHI